MLLPRLPMALIAVIAPSSLAAQSFANQIEVQNCGLYEITQAKLQGHRTTGSWTTVECWGQCGDGNLKKLKAGEALCFDLTDKSTDWTRFRLIMNISAGESDLKTDDTNFDPDADQRRVFRMKGTTQNNNDPRSRGYKATLGSSQCDKDGKQDFRVNCTNLGQASPPDPSSWRRTQSQPTASG